MPGALIGKKITRPGRLGSLGTISEIGLWRREAETTYALQHGTATCIRVCVFSGSSNHLIHAFLAVASLGNLCPPKLLHLGTQHSVPRLFLLRLSMPPTATHQQDNSYGRSAIWRVSKFVIPLITAFEQTRRYATVALFCEQI